MNPLSNYQTQREEVTDDDAQSGKVHVWKEVEGGGGSHLVPGPLDGVLYDGREGLQGAEWDLFLRRVPLAGKRERESRQFCEPSYRPNTKHADTVAGVLETPRCPISRP